MTRRHIASQLAMTTHGRRAAKRPSRSSARDMVVSLGGAAPISAASASTVCPTGGLAHRPRAATSPCLRPRASQPFGRSRRAGKSLG